MLHVRDRKLEWRDETVTLARQIRDVARTLLAITKATAHVGHLDPEVTGLDHEIAPGSRHQFALTHNFACALDQRDQDVQSSAPQRDGDAALAQDTCSRKKTKLSERY